MAINTFTASGNLGKDCEVRYTPNGKGIASFSLPVKQGYGEHEKTSWVTCKMFGKKAEGDLPQYLTKGTKVTVTGAFVLEEWQGQNGETNKMPVILVNDLDFGGNNQQGQNFAPQNQQNMRDNGASGSQMSDKQFQTPKVADDDFSDSIPF